MSALLPKQPGLLWALSMVVWITAPSLSEKYFIVTQSLGWYSPESDTIAIPIAGNFIFAVVGFPFWFFLCHLAFRRYPASSSIVIWDSRHPIYSTVISLIFGLLTLINAFEIPTSFSLCREIVSKGDPRDAIHTVFFAIASFGWILVWACMRSCFIAKKMAEQSGAVNPHAFDTFVTHPADAGSAPKASGDT